MIDALCVWTAGWHVSILQGHMSSSSTDQPRKVLFVLEHFELYSVVQAAETPESCPTSLPTLEASWLHTRSRDLCNLAAPATPPPFCSSNLIILQLELQRHSSTFRQAPLLLRPTPCALKAARQYAHHRHHSTLRPWRSVDPFCTGFDGKRQSPSPGAS